MNLAVTAAAVLGLGLVAALRASSQPAGAYLVDYVPTDDDQQTTTLTEDIAVTLDPSTYIPAAVPAATAAQNERAFLDMIAISEGVRPGMDGYRTLFGGGLFDSFADHPRQVFTFTDRAGRTLRTSAAGRYQFLARTWDDLARRLQLPDFGPDSQDMAALELVRQRGAANDVQAGRIPAAIAKCAPIWASLPGAGYAQRENALSTLVAAYTDAGGTLETTA